MKKILKTILSKKRGANIVLHLFILIPVAFIAGKNLLERVMYELSGPITIDSTLYLGVGRGILNGLIPYKDLFETKPPGVFILSSISLWLTGGTGLVSILQTIAILVIPIALILVLRNLLKEEKNSIYGIVLQCIAAIFGMLWALYSADRSGEFQVESFGAAFAAVYLVVITSTNSLCMGKWRMGLASLFLLASVGMKEPFLLIILASVLLLYPQSPRVILDRFVKPFGIAAALGIVILLFLGYLLPYINIYLPEMLGRHIYSGSSMVERGGDWRRLYNDLDGFASYLGIVTIVFIVYSLCLHSIKLRPIQSVIGVFNICLALFFTVAAVGMGGQYWNHHFVFALPVYLVVTAIFLGRIVHINSKFKYVLSYASIGYLLFICVNYPTQNFEARLVHINKEVDRAKYIAGIIDEVLDSCDLDRYLYLGKNGIHPFAYTEHSPLGPNFFQYHYLLNDERKNFQQTFLGNLSNADLLVLRSYEIGSMRKPAETFISNHFTKIPWSCAGDVKLPKRYEMYFRL